LSTADRQTSQLTWAASLPIGCYYPHVPSPFIIVNLHLTHLVSAVLFGRCSCCSSDLLSISVGVAHVSGQRGRPALSNHQQHQQDPPSVRCRVPPFKSLKLFRGLVPRKLFSHSGVKWQSAFCHIFPAFLYCVCC